MLDDKNDMSKTLRDSIETSTPTPTLHRFTVFRALQVNNFEHGHDRINAERYVSDLGFRKKKCENVD